jgi:hypothetical protein
MIMTDHNDLMERAIARAENMASPEYAEAVSIFTALPEGYNLLYYVNTTYFSRGVKKHETKKAEVVFGGETIIKTSGSLSAGEAFRLAWEHHAAHDGDEPYKGHYWFMFDPGYEDILLCPHYMDGVEE